jgi:hypothetical protein
MRAGDVCEVEIEGIGRLSNPIVDEVNPEAARLVAGFSALNLDR